MSIKTLSDVDQLVGDQQPIAHYATVKLTATEVVLLLLMSLKGSLIELRTLQTIRKWSRLEQCEARGFNYSNTFTATASL
jgi:hypothetical protein